MTREEHYLAGLVHGERWAEKELDDGLGIYHDTKATLREGATALVRSGSSAKTYALGYESEKAYALGLARGFRSITR